MLACVILKHPAMTDVLQQLERFSPLIEVGAPGTFLLDLGVLTKAKAYTVAESLLKTLKDYEPQIGLAEARFVAAIAARMFTESGYRLVLPEEIASFLAPQPIQWLPIEAETLRRLELLGMRTLADIAKLSLVDLTEQFGAEGSRMAALVRGIDETPLEAVQPQEGLSREISWSFPVSGGEGLQEELQGMLEGLCATLQARGQLATRARLTFALEKAAPVTLSLGFPSPLNDAKRLFKVLRERLRSLQTAHPISGMILFLEGFVQEYARQLTFAALFPSERRWRGLERVIERLSVREDPPCLLQVQMDSPEARIPERRAHLQDRVIPTRRRGLYLPKPISVAADASGSPQHVRLRSGWVGVDRLVEAWEIEDDWWTMQPLQRSYFRVMLQNGAILRLFREARSSRWYQQTR